MEDYEETYEEIWKEIIEPNGSVSMDQVKRELFDYWVLMRRVAEVYVNVTGGLLSKTNYHPSVVISAADEHYRKVYEEEAAV